MMLLQRLRKNLNTQGRQLLKIHLRRAFIHVQACMFMQEQVYDVCGANGDLYWLLKTVHDDIAEFRLQSTYNQTFMGMMHTCLRKIVDELAQDTDPPLILSLSAKELMCMED